MNLSISKFSNENRDIWNAFVISSKNGTFLFLRDYMDYHAERFTDHSLMFFDDKELIALFPANIQNENLYSHNGLTFGGIISNAKMTTLLMLELFEKLKLYMKDKGLKELYYKTIPYIYHIYPAEEDRYALFVNNFQLYRRDVLTVVYQNNKLNFQERRKRAIKKAEKQNVQVSLDNSDNAYEQYWDIVNSILLEKYNTLPVHSVAEIKYLKNTFSDNIKLFISKKDGEIVAGIVVYINNTNVHVQYIATSDKGKEIGALDFLINYLLNIVFVDKEYFDFGISNENNGLLLNEGLIAQKEGFGARAVVHDFYKLEII